ncbi:O-methyltransferase [Streptomyces sp. NPDC057445]|uniref:O-methyltransferase n=1 Tax=Streptomyces sp. NPDC057445 TaxID=3346136 RepID=UPI003689A036
MDDTPRARPGALDAILADAAALGFAMSCEERTGSLLATLAASKPGGRFLELGTGVGAGAAWLLHGMTEDTSLTSVEADPAVQAVAAKHLAHDHRATFTTTNAWLTAYTGPPISLAYVDCRPGKIHRLADLIALLERGGLYIADDLLPQPTWPDDHQSRVDAFLAHLPEHPNLLYTPLRWASGLLIGTRV